MASAHLSEDLFVQHEIQNQLPPAFDLLELQEYFLQGKRRSY